MLFVRSGDLKKDMRLARSVYNSRGELLFEKNSSITTQMLETIEQKGILGLYILGTGESSLPEEEQNYELEKDVPQQAAKLKLVLESPEDLIDCADAIDVIASDIVEKYGSDDGKMQIYQVIRTKHDYAYIHMVNVAILAARISHFLDFPKGKQRQLCIAALIHEMALLNVDTSILMRRDMSVKEAETFCDLKLKYVDLVSMAYPDRNMIKKLYQEIQELKKSCLGAGDLNVEGCSNGGAILMIAEHFDEMTSAGLFGTPKSAYVALEDMFNKPLFFSTDALRAFTKSIRILEAGTTVELNTGEMGMILSANPDNVLRPTILSFKDNSIIDLTSPVNEDVEIVDIVRNTDKRHVMG